jgi:hypothetical protein
VTGRPELPPFESILGLVLLQDGSPLLIGREPDPLSREIVPLSTHRGSDARGRAVRYEDARRIAFKRGRPVIRRE